jgi:hypothetical protein
MVDQVILASDDPFIGPAGKGEFVQVRAIGRMNSGALEKLQEPLSKSVEKCIHSPRSSGWNKD